MADMLPEQLQKMGMLETPQAQKSPTTTTKRKSTDFTKLGSLSKFGTVGFSNYREAPTPRKKTAKNKDDDDAMDSDPDDDVDRPAKDADEAEVLDQNGNLLSPEDARKQGELADGVRKIKVRHSYRSLYYHNSQSKQLKRVHSSEAVADTRKSPHLTGTDSPTIGTPQSGNSTAATVGTPPEHTKVEDQGLGVASPYKKQRASMDGLDSTILTPLDSAQDTTSTAIIQPQAPTTASAPVTSSVTAQQRPQLAATQEEDEEL